MVAVNTITINTVARKGATDTLSLGAGNRRDAILAILIRSRVQWIAAQCESAMEYRDNSVAGKK